MKARAHSSRSRPWLVAAGLAAGGFVLYSIFNKAAAAPASPAPGTPTGPSAGSPYTPGALASSVPGVSFAPSTLQPGILTSTLTAVPAVTSSQVATAQSFWSSLQPVAPIDTGYITFPSGSQVAASLMGSGNTAMDGSGNYYVQWAGQVYQLGIQDSSGNWPARVVGS